MFVACFSVAEVSLVSMVAVQGCAVVMAVSCWPASAVAEVPPVSTPPRGCVLRANLFALRGPMVCVSAKKFARRAENIPISVFLGLLGELFRGNAAEGAVLGEFCRG